MTNHDISPLVVSIGGVVKLTTMSQSTIYKTMREDPNFPKSKKIKGLRRTVWIRAEVEAWVMSSLETA